MIGWWARGDSSPGPPPVRKIMSRTFQFMARKVFNLPDFKDITAPFKLMRTEVAKEIAGECKYMRESFWTEFTIRAYKKGYRIGEVPVTHRPRLGGTQLHQLSYYHQYSEILTLYGYSMGRRLLKPRPSHFSTVMIPVFLGVETIHQ